MSVLVKPFGPEHLRNAMEAMLARPIGVETVNHYLKLSQDIDS